MKDPEYQFSVELFAYMVKIFRDNNEAWQTLKSMVESDVPPTNSAMGELCPNCQGHVGSSYGTPVPCQCHKEGRACVVLEITKCRKGPCFIRLTQDQ